MVTKKIILAMLIGIIMLPLSGPVQAKKGKFLSHFSGNLSNRYRLRTTGGESDSDLESLVTLNIGDPTYQSVTASVQGGGIFDLDGQNSTFQGIYDSFDGRAVGRLYYAYMSVQKTYPFQLLRIGRQHHYDFENFYFDGVSFDSNPFYGIKISAYAGKPVHLYESEIGWDENDWIVGEALSWTPIKQIRLRFDHAYLKDRASAFRVTQGDMEDSLFGGTAWVDITKNIDSYARVTAFDDQLRDFTFASTLRLPKQDFRLGVKVYRLLESYDIRVPELDAYSIAGTYLRFTEFKVNAVKGLGKHFSIDGGYGLRMLDQEQVASPFNHGFHRGYLSLSSIDLINKGLTLTATGDYYRGTDNTLRNDYFGGSFSASQQLLKKRLVVSGGTDYYLYRFNFATGNESNDVQTYYLRVDAKPYKSLRLRSGYEFENNDLNGYHTFNLAIIEDF